MMPGLPSARLWGDTAPPGTATAFLAVASALLFGASPASAQSIAVEHEALGCIVAGHFTRVAACFTATAPIAAARAVFRAAGTTHWYSVEMSPSGDCHGGFLPKPKRSTRSVEYYIEAIDRTGAEGRTPDYAPRVEVQAAIDKAPKGKKKK